MQTIQNGVYVTVDETASAYAQVWHAVGGVASLVTTSTVAFGTFMHYVEFEQVQGTLTTIVRIDGNVVGSVATPVAIMGRFVTFRCTTAWALEAALYLDSSEERIYFQNTRY